MVDKEELRKMHILKDMPERLLEKISSVTHLQIFSADTVLFRQNQQLKYFYMLLTGQVSIEVEISPNVGITLGTIEPGFSCGVSSFIPGSTSSSAAICIETCEFITLSSEKMFEIFQQDRELAYNMMVRVVRLFKHVMDHRTILFFKNLENHPELLQSFQELADFSSTI